MENNKKVKPPTLQTKGFEDDNLIVHSDESAGEELDNHGTIPFNPKQSRVPRSEKIQKISSPKNLVRDPEGSQRNGRGDRRS